MSSPPAPAGGLNTYHRDLYAHVATLLSAVRMRRMSIPPNNPNRKSSMSAAEPSGAPSSSSRPSVRTRESGSGDGGGGRRRSLTSSMVTPSLVGDSETKGEDRTETEAAAATVFDDDDSAVVIADDADEPDADDGPEPESFPPQTAKPVDVRSAHATPCAPRLVTRRLASPETPSERAEEYRRAWEADGRHIWMNVPAAFELKLGASRSRRGSRDSANVSASELASGAHAVQGLGLSLPAAAPAAAPLAAASSSRPLSHAPSQASLRSSSHASDAAARREARHRRRAAELRARVEAWLAGVATDDMAVAYGMPAIVPDIPSPSALRRDAFLSLAADPNLSFAPGAGLPFAPGPSRLRRLGPGPDLVLPLISPRDALPLAHPRRGSTPLAHPPVPDVNLDLAAKLHALDELAARHDLDALARRMSTVVPYVPLAPPVVLRNGGSLDTAPASAAVAA